MMDLGSLNAVGIQNTVHRGNKILLFLLAPPLREIFKVGYVQSFKHPSLVFYMFRSRRVVNGTIFDAYGLGIDYPLHFHA